MPEDEIVVEMREKCGATICKKNMTPVTVFSSESALQILLIKYFNIFYYKGNRSGNGIGFIIGV